MEQVKLHYFKGRGRAETTRWMLAANHSDFINVAVESPESLAALRASGKLPFDQLPLLEIDGQCLSQSSAMVRFLARRGDFYGATDHDALCCDLIAAATDDFAETAMQAPFQPTIEQACSAMQARFEKFGPRFEARLKDNLNDNLSGNVSGKTPGNVNGNKLSFGDIVLASALTEYLERIPNLLEKTPLLADLQARVIEQPGIAAYLESPQRYAIAGDDYVIDVARVLQRALPGHMPDPNRFVKG